MRKRWRAPCGGARHTLRTGMARRGSTGPTSGRISFVRAGTLSTSTAGPPPPGTPAGAPNPEAGTFLRARNANEVLRAQTAKLRLQKLAGDLVDRTKATGLVFELARRERDSWMNWPPRVAANMAAELGVDAHKMELVLDKFIRSHLADLSEIKLELR